ncbi:MAG TPA: hypothetical protein PKK31_02005 [Elusimicrobiales bacterium]|nr:hypothetical protein [Elusimicrobiales bacterium]
MLLKKRFYLSLLLAVCAAAAWFLSPYLLRAAFSVSGTVELEPVPGQKVLKSNTMLFIVARGEAGVPFAVLKIINPSFPLQYSMDGSDLILPELLPFRFRLEAFLNTHGEIGVPRPGDFYGATGEELLLISKAGDLLLRKKE